MAVETHDVLSAFREEGRNLAWPGEAIDRLSLVTRRSRNGGQEHEVRAYALTDENVDAAIGEQVAYFDSLGVAFEWKAFSYDSPGNLLSRLEAGGFSIGPLEKIVVYPLTNGLAPFEGGHVCEVRKVERVEQLGDFRRVAEAVFKKDYSLTTGQLEKAIREGLTGHDAYVGYVEGAPVSIGRLYTDPNSAFAGLYGGGTLPEHRGRGCYRAVIAARAKDAYARGARYLQVDALPTSLPILLQLGFVPIADTWACTPKT